MHMTSPPKAKAIARGEALGLLLKEKTILNFPRSLRNIINVMHGSLLIANPLCTPLEKHFWFSSVSVSLGHMSMSTPYPKTFHA